MVYCGTSEEDIKLAQLLWDQAASIARISLPIRFFILGNSGYVGILLGFYAGIIEGRYINEVNARAKKLKEQKKQIESKSQKSEKINILELKEAANKGDLQAKLKLAMHYKLNISKDKLNAKEHILGLKKQL